MKTLSRMLLVAAIAALLLQATATASVQLTLGGANYLGHFTPANPANPTTETNRINTLATLAPGALPTSIGGVNYDRVSSTLAGPFVAASIVDDFNNNGPDNTITLPDNFQYVLGKYGQHDYVWYSVTGFTGDIEVPADFGPGQGLSHISAYNVVTTVVPEPGTIAVWGLLAVTGYFGAKKWQAKA